jgi:hypothetical protein
MKWKTWGINYPEEVDFLCILKVKPSEIDSIEDISDLVDALRSLLRHFDNEISDPWFVENNPRLRFLTSTAKRARVQMLLEDCNARLTQLKHLGTLDTALLTRLNAALEIVTHASGHVYLRRWVMPDGVVWFKVGITNNPDRREAEQNVLPVPMETVTCTDVGSIERARALEAAIHRVLDEQRITGAKNRELFHMTDAQVATVKAVIEKLI